MDSKMLGGWWVKLRIFLGMFTPNHLGEDFHPFWQLHMFQMGWFTARLSCWATWPRPVATGAFCWVSCGGFGAKSHDMICRKLKDGENDVLFEEISIVCGKKAMTIMSSLHLMMAKGQQSSYQVDPQELRVLCWGRSHWKHMTKRKQIDLGPRI